MKIDVAPHDLQKIWQSQKPEFMEMSLDEIRKRAQKQRRKVQRRNAIEYVALALVVGFMGFVIWTSDDPMMRAGAALSIIAGLYMGYQLHKRGTANAEPTDRGLVTWLGFHRRELERQHDLLRNSWRWYLGPPIPSLVVFALAGAISNPGHLPHPWLAVAVYSTVVAAVFVRVRAMHVQCAQNLQRQIDELNAVDTERMAV
jgi:hypothetical protein